jgi:hypothetical protein
MQFHPRITASGYAPSPRLKGILVVGIIMFFVLMPFFALKEIGRDIGDGKLYEVFFIRRTKYTPQQSLSSK